VGSQGQASALVYAPPEADAALFSSLKRRVPFGLLFSEEPKTNIRIADDRLANRRIGIDAANQLRQA
jgi:hypothetical protein